MPDWRVKYGAANSILKMKPVFFAKIAQEGRYRFQCAVLTGPFDVFCQEKHFPQRGGVIPRSKN